MFTSAQIKKRVKEDQIRNEAKVYAEGLAAIGRNAMWYESKSKFEVARQRKFNEQKMKVEEVLAQKELLLRRKARLQALLENEAVMYEQELHAKGLALYRERH